MAAALSRAGVYFSINEIKRGRRDVNIIARRGRRPDESLTAGIAGKLDSDPHVSARRLAHSLGIAPPTVCRA
jgi:hypothetical protein